MLPTNNHTTPTGAKAAGIAGCLSCCLIVVVFWGLLVGLAAAKALGYW